MTLAQMRLFLREAAKLDREREKRAITAIRAAVWAEADDLKAALRE